MIWSILAEASGVRGKVWMAMSFPLARTVICATVALMTVPSNFGNCGRFGFIVATTIGTAVAITGTATEAGTCALAAATAEKANPAASAQRSRANCATNFIPGLRWRCAAILESEYLAESWPAWQRRAVRDQVHGKSPDRPECAVIPESGDRAW